MNTLIKPVRYDIFRQNLMKQYIELQFVGYVTDISAARNMCKVLHECDPDAKSGFATYLFKLSEVKHEETEQTA